MNFLIRITTAALFIIATSTLLAQGGPPDPNGGNNPTQGGNEPVTAAPIGSGLVFLLGLAAAYGGRKTYKLCKKRKVYG